MAVKTIIGKVFALHRQGVTAMRLHRCALIGSLLCSLLAINPCLATANRLVAGVVHGAPPYIWVGRNQQPQGIYVDLLRALKPSKDTQIDFRRLPHERRAQELILGDLDMALLIVKPGLLELPADTSQVIITEQPLLEVAANLYSASRRQLVIGDLKGIDFYDNLDGFQLGSIRTGRNKIHRRFLGKDNVVLFTSYKSMVKSLLAGRIDLVLLDPLMADYWETKLSAKLKLQAPYRDIPIYAVFSIKALGPEAMTLCEEFWQRLVSLKQSGELKHVFTRYQHSQLVSYVAPRLAADGPACRVGTPRQEKTRAPLNNAAAAQAFRRARNLQQ